MRQSWIRNMRIAILATVLVSTGAAAVPSAAWALSSNGPLSFTATAPGARLTFPTAPTLSAMQCTSATLTGRIGGPIISTAWINNPTPSEDGAPFKFNFAVCTLSGFPVTATCPATVNFFANTFNGSVIGGELRSLACTIAIPALPMCTISVTSVGPLSRATPVTYTNPPAGKFSLPVAGQTLAVTWSTCPLFSNPSGSAAGTLTNIPGTSLVYTATPAVPNFW